MKAWRFLRANRSPRTPEDKLVKALTLQRWPEKEELEYALFCIQFDWVVRNGCIVIAILGLVTLPMFGYYSFFALVGGGLMVALKHIELRGNFDELSTHFSTVFQYAPNAVAVEEVDYSLKQAMQTSLESEEKQIIESARSFFHLN